MSFLDSDAVTELLDRAGLGGLAPRALKAAAILVALLVILALWRFWPAAPAPEVSFDAQAGERAAGDADAEEPAADVVVHVAGAVMQPGVYRLPPGSRVADAIAAAGGGLGTAAPDSLNLARILADGEQVLVPTLEQIASGIAAAPGIAGQAAPSASGTQGSTVDINRASASELEQLPGVGPATAQKIVDDREANGPFAKPEDLMRVPGIGAKKFEAMQEFVSCG